MSQDDEKGIRVGNLESVPDRFKCSHCQLLLREPMQGDCGHRYCKNCVHIKWKEAQSLGLPSLCDACEEDDDERETISPDRTYPDRAMRVEMKRLRVRCPNEGCSEEMTLKQLESHVTECPMKPQACQNCGREVAQARMDEHRRSDCPKRPCECDACGEMVAYDELDEHKRNSCIGSTRQCEFCGVRVKDDDSSMEEHVRSDCAVPWREGEACPYGCGDVQDWRRHRQECVTKHIDRTLARVKQLELQRPAAAAAAAASAEEATSSPSLTSAQADSASGGPSVPVDVLSDSERLRRRLQTLTQSTEELEKSVTALRLPTEVADESQTDRNKFIARLSSALEQGAKINSIINRIKTHFELSDSRIGQYEEKLRKNLAKRLEIEKKHQELVKLLAYKEVRIAELERRIEILEHASYDGVLVWKVTNVKRRKEEAREGKVCSIYSPPFYTGKAGYKMRGRLYLNGDGTGKNTHISLFFVIMRGEYDALLPWPFSKKVSMMLLDQNSEEHVIDAFKPDVSSSSFKRPTTAMNIASGCPLFMPISDFENESKGYVKDDTMFIKFIVDKSGLPS